MNQYEVIRRLIGRIARISLILRAQLIGLQLISSYSSYEIPSPNCILYGIRMLLIDFDTI